MEKLRIKHRKILFFLLIILLVTVSIKIYFNSKMIVEYFPSPTGDYKIEMKFTSAFHIGYHGGFYLFVNKNKYFLNNYAPERCKWISDKEFTIGSAGSIIGMYKYNVDDVIKMGAKKSAETIYPAWEVEKTN